MAVPTLSSITPSSGHTGGRQLVELVGTNFRLPTAPPLTGKTTAPKPSLRVTIGGEEASNVRVLSATKAWCLTPIHDPTPAPVAVSVQNLDSNGAPIAGEIATLAAAYSFVLPKLTDEYEADFTRLVRTLVRELKRQVHPEVALTTHTEFDAETGDQLNIAQLAKLPGLILVGPETPENKFYSLQGTQHDDIPGDPNGAFIERRPPETIDLIFDLIGVSDRTLELLNLLAVVKLFFKKNPFLFMPRDPADASKGKVKYELRGADFRVAPTVNNSNVRTFSGRVTVVGFDLEDMAGLPQATIPGGPAGDAEATVGHGLSLDEDGVVLDEPQQTEVP